MNTQEKLLRLHLGCGDKYLDGYVNIDYPQSEHTVMAPKVDRVADIRTLSYPDGSVDEIRSHHLFEHFNRPGALRLLMNWRRWLKPDGVLVIETPDFEVSASEYLRSRSLRRRFQLGRHMFGSQEAAWAIHLDFWDRRKYQFVLKKTGFKNITVRSYWHGIAKHAKKLPGVGGFFAKLPESVYLPVLNPLGRLVPSSFYEKHGSNSMPNILAVAKKDATVALDEEAVALEILKMSLVGKEEAIFKVWADEFKSLP